MARLKADPMEREIESAFLPGEFMRDGACLAFVSGLESVAAKVGALVANDPARAALLYEAFVAGCYLKVEELHDSYGGFGQFVQDLIRGWIKARQAAAANADETVSRLLAWMDNDPYSLCSQIEKEAVKAFNKAGLAAFAARIRTRFDAGTSEGKPLEYAHRRAGEILRTVYARQGNPAAFVALAEETGLTSRDCHTLATMFVARRQKEEALEWVERGMALEKEYRFASEAGLDLRSLHRELLVKLGRPNEALDAAWTEYVRDPNKYSYDVFMKFVPMAERAVWHGKAMEAAGGHTGLHSRIELYVEVKEWDRLADLVLGASGPALEAVSHYATEPAAVKLEKSHPDAAARLWRAQGMRIVNAKKSRYYEAAASNFKRAKRCYERAALEAEWLETVQTVRAAHFRKIGFMTEFEVVVSGSAPKRQPSFLEQAKAKWRGGKGSGTV